MTDEKGRLDNIYLKRKNLSDRYSLDNTGNRFNYSLLHEHVKQAVHKIFDDITKIKVLEIGAGELFWISEISGMGVPAEQCLGIDLLWWRMREGREKGRKIAATVGSGADLPLKSNSFDLICQFTMMTSVVDKDLKRQIAAEIMRVLKPGGYFLWYDFRYNNPANSNTRAIGRSELTSLFKEFAVTPVRLTLLPPLARRLKSVSLLKLLYRIPMLRSHYIALLGPKKEANK